MNGKIKIFKDGEKVLRKKAKEVPLLEIKTEKIQTIIKKLGEIILEVDEAVAAAAPQIGESWQIFVISEWSKNPRPEKLKSEFKNLVFVNPKVLKISKEKTPAQESCLSKPELMGDVLRAAKIKVEAYDENGKKFTLGASGLLAQAIQHEVDHLNGVLFVDRAINITGVKNNPD